LTKTKENIVKGAQKQDVIEKEEKEDRGSKRSLKAREEGTRKPRRQEE
jgi:hypothetical protein